MDFNGVTEIPLDITKLVWEFVGFRDDNFFRAAEGGHLDMLKWFHKNFKMTGFCVRSAENAMFRIAAKNGHLEVLQWLASTFHLTVHDITQFSYTSSCWAASRGHLHVLMWMRDAYGTLAVKQSVRHAAFYGHVHILEWYRQINLSTLSGGVQEAVDCLRWLVQTENHEAEKKLKRVCDWNQTKMKRVCDWNRIKLID